MKMLKYLSILVLSFFIISCSHKVDQANFDKVKNDMTFEQVKSILGKPTKERHVDIGALSATVAIWGDKKNSIVIQLINDKVTYKNFSSDGVNKFELK